MICFVLVNTSAPNAQYFTPGGDSPGKFTLYSYFLFTNSFQFIMTFNQDRRLREEWKRAINSAIHSILLSLANLVVYSIGAIRNRRSCKKSVKYDLRMELQKTASQGTEPQEVVLQDMDLQEADPQGIESQEAASPDMDLQEAVLQDMGLQEAVPEVIEVKLSYQQGTTNGQLDSEDVF